MTMIPAYKLQDRRLSVEPTSILLAKVLIKVIVLLTVGITFGVLLATGI